MKTRIEHERVDEHPGEWIEVGPLSFGFKAQWREVTSDEAAIELALPTITDWHLQGVKGQPLPAPDGKLSADLPVETAAFIVRAVGTVLRERVSAPLAKASPSPA